MLTQAYKVSLCPTEIINIVIKTAYFISDHEIVKINHKVGDKNLSMLGNLNGFKVVSILGKCRRHEPKLFRNNFEE